MDQEQPRRPKERRSDTPRVDAFMRSAPPISVRDVQQGFEVIYTVREVEGRWENFAKALERELVSCLPSEWRDQKVREALNDAHQACSNVMRFEDDYEVRNYWGALQDQIREALESLE